MTRTAGLGRALAALATALSLAACGGGNGPRVAGPSAGSVECAPYARRITGMALYGPAASWWQQSTGRYAHASAPLPGSVLVFRATGRLPYGHVSVVTRVLSAREVTVTQANWVHHRIAAADAVADVSSGNDWSLVRVWWAPAGTMGRTAYPTYGFILPATAGADPGPVAAAVPPDTPGLGLPAQAGLAMCRALSRPDGRDTGNGDG